MRRKAANQGRDLLVLLLGVQGLAVGDCSQFGISFLGGRREVGYCLFVGLFRGALVCFQFAFELSVTSLKYKVITYVSIRVILTLTCAL
jgi:hypothetical protein